MEILIILALVGGVIAFVAVSKKKKAPTNPVPIDPVDNTDKNEDLISTGPILEKVGDHEILKIYVNKMPEDVWKCINCETENPNNAKRCCVCNRER